MDQIQEIGLRLQAPVVIDEDDIVGEYAIDRLCVTKLERLVPGLFHSTIFDVTIAESS